jgi:hypothetical protein
VNCLQQQWVFSESLHGLDNDVHEAQSIAVLLRLAPLQMTANTQHFLPHTNLKFFTAKRIC